MFDFLLGKDKDQIDREYSKAIGDTKQAKADAAYNYYYNKAAYDKNKDYFNSLGIQDPAKSYWNKNGQLTNALAEGMGQYNKYLSELSKEREDVARQNKYNIFGNGLIGGFLNPFHQAGTAAQDFVTSGTREWDRGNRDIVSDLGAIGEVGLDLATLGSASGASAGAKTLGKTVGKGALLGASYGGLGSLADMGSKNFNLGGLLGSAALGGAMGGGLSAAGYGIGKVADKLGDVAKKNRAVRERIGAELYNDMDNLVARNGVSYQDALKKAGLDQANNPADYAAIGNIMSGKSLPTDIIDNPQRISSLTNKVNTFTKELGGEVASSKASTAVGAYNPIQSLYDALNNTRTIPYGSYTTIETYPGLASGRWGRAAQGIGDLIKNMPQTAKNVTSRAKATKIGDNASRILKTKAGKVGAGVGGGLLISQLLNNKGEQ